MGLTLDTSTLVSAERRGHSVRDIFAQLHSVHGTVPAGLSAVTLVELAHGIERAKPDARRKHRQSFLDDLVADMAIYPLTTEIARLAGSISGKEADRGITLPFADLLIGATALHLGFEVVTENIRHFAMIPNLVVKQF